MQSSLLLLTDVIVMVWHLTAALDSMCDRFIYIVWSIHVHSSIDSHKQCDRNETLFVRCQEEKRWFHIKHTKQMQLDSWTREAIIHPSIHHPSLSAWTWASTHFASPRVGDVSYPPSSKLITFPVTRPGLVSLRLTRAIQSKSCDDVTATYR